MTFAQFLSLYWEADPQYPQDFTSKAGLVVSIEDVIYEAINEDGGVYTASANQFDGEGYEFKPSSVMPDFKIYTLSVTHIA